MLIVPSLNGFAKKHVDFSAIIIAVLFVFCIFQFLLDTNDIQSLVSNKITEILILTADYQLFTTDLRVR